MKKIIISSAIGLAIIFSIIWFGFYNVAANNKHFSITTSLLELVRTRSIEARTTNIKVPDLTGASQIKRGAKNYADMCTGCHLAPGMQVTELNQGLYPRPPVFSNKDYQNQPAIQFWVIKNGLKMTGMPSWAPAHSDQQIWEMVAFINQSKHLSTEDYQQLILNKDAEHKEDGHAH